MRNINNKEFGAIKHTIAALTKSLNSTPKE
jgi:hypothetical protein